MRIIYHQRERSDRLECLLSRGSAFSAPAIPLLQSVLKHILHFK